MQDSQHDRGRSIGAIVLIGVGVVFLLGQLLLGMDVTTVVNGVFSIIDWPFFILLPGLVLLAVAFYGGRGAAPVAFPGAVITGTGLILLYQNVTDSFESWSYLWGLYPVFVGLAMIFVGTRTGKRHMIGDGRRAVITGLSLTAIFGLFMEFLFSGNADLLFSYFVPLLLIGGGVLLLFRGRRRDADTLVEKPKNDPFLMPDDKPKHDYGIDPALERRIKDALDE